MLEPTSEVIAHANEILAEHSAFMDKIREAQKARRRLLHTLESPPRELFQLPLLPASNPSKTPELDSPPPSPIPAWSPPDRPNLPPPKRARVAKYRNYVPEEETIRNDYSQHYVDSGEWPQNFVIGAEPEKRFEEYPKQRRFLNLKKENVANNSLPPSYLPYSELEVLQGSKFDVIMLDPPFSSAFTWDDLEEMPVPSLAADPSFVFLWVGSGAGEGLERGREILAKWGYRRCEDVTWVKTNRYSNLGPGTDPPTTSLLTRTKQHCLIGIRGTVRRSTDNWFVHCNVDTDVILWEGDTTDPIRKPPEIYSLVENFCLGLRRLDIFGRAASSLRRGWLTVFTEEQYTQLLERVSVDGQIHVEPLSEETAPSTARKWEKAGWEHGLKELAERAGGKMVVPHSDDIEMLRPKSPAPKHRGGNATGGSTGGNTDGAFRFQNQNQMRQPQPQPPFMSGPINMMGTQSMMMDGGMQMPMGMFGQMPMMMNAAQYGMNPMVTAGGLGEQWMDQQNELGNWDPTMQGMQGMSGMQGMHGMQGMPGMQGMQGHWEGQGGFS